MTSPVLLLDKILSFKDRSPLITVLDDSCQSGRPLLREFIKRASRTKRTVVYVCFEEPTGPAWMSQISNIQTVRGLKPLNERLANSPHGPESGLRPLSAILKDIQGSLSAKSQTSLVIIDCITPVFREPSLDPIHFLGLVLALQPYSAILLHHIDIPLPLKYPHYPSALLLLSHISTTVLRVSSFRHHTLRLDAESQALPDPVERDSAREGVLSPFGTNSPQRVIVYLEYRRKSGRTISEKCLLNLLSGRVEPLVKESAGKSPAGIGLDFGTTFNLGLTQRQKKSKEDVVLPHFSAQGVPPNDNARGDAAEIEYTLDAEDDFDDEEDVDEDLLI